MGNKSLLDVVVDANKLCKLWLLSLIPVVLLIVGASLLFTLADMTVAAPVSALFILMGVVLLVWDFVLSIKLLSDFSKLLSDTSSEHYQKLKFLKNILIAIWVCFVIGTVVLFMLFLATEALYVGIAIAVLYLVLKIIFFIKSKDFN